MILSQNLKVACFGFSIAVLVACGGGGSDSGSSSSSDPTSSSTSSSSTSSSGSAFDSNTPSIPVSLSVSAVSETQIDLHWVASTDNSGVSGYRIYRDGVEIGTSSATTYSDSGLSAATMYSYTVSAYDEQGNVSEQCSAASAATILHYVRADASGVNDGSDWIDAWTQLPSALERGATYYIADGLYPGYTFDDVEDGFAYITIKKAIESDHGTNTGWQLSYGDGQAQFTDTAIIWIFRNGYYVIDGQTGELNQSRGIKLFYSGSGTNIYAINVDSVTSKAIFLHFKHIEIDLGGWALGNIRRDGFRINRVQEAHDLTFESCYFHHINRAAWGISAFDVSNILIDRCFTEFTGPNSPEPHSQVFTHHHSDGVYQNVTIRNSVFKDHTSIGGTGYLTPGHDSIGIGTGYFIYGNTFIETSPLSGPSEVIGNTLDGQSTEVMIYNNNFINLKNCDISFNGNNLSVAKNNIFYNCTKWPTFSFMLEHDYNSYSNADYHDEANSLINLLNPFADIDNYDFRLTSPQPGTSLDSQFDKDPNKIMRGFDGVWDRGAYEFDETINN